MSRVIGRILGDKKWLARGVFSWLVILIFTTACGGEGEETIQLIETPVPPTQTPASTVTPRQQAATATPIPSREPTRSAPQATPTAEDASLPDLSGVSLYEVTHLMDPRLFQVSVNGWPAGIPDDLLVRVGLEFYTCEVLFPDDFPERLYCWGKAPPKGTEVKIQFILEDIPLPLLEIPFRVPYPIKNDN